MNENNSMRMPPWSEEAELGLLGSILLLPEVIDEVDAQPKHFFEPANATLFQHMHAMHVRGERVDYTLLVERLKSAGDFAAVGGLPRLGKIVESVVNAAHAAYYAKIVREKYERREAIRAATAFLADAYDESLDLGDVLARHEHGLQSIEETGDQIRVVTLGEAAHAAVELVKRRRQGKVPGGMETGLETFDGEIGGLFGGELIILAARPGCGKTSLAMQVATNIVEIGQPVLFASLEMGPDELALRELAGEARIDLTQLRTGRLSDADMLDLEAAAASLTDSPLMMPDVVRISAINLRRLALRLHRKTPLSMVVVDYIGLMTPAETRIPRHEQVAQITRDLKHLARDLRVPVLALAQLNRDSEASKSRPKLSNLRESGAIEQDADVVLFLHREELNRPDDPDLKNTAELIVAKNRNGPTGTFMLQFEAWRTRFVTPTVDPSLSF